MSGLKAVCARAKARRTIAARSAFRPGVNIVARRFIVDETMGSVVAFCTFGVGGIPDSHLFRVEKGKLRYVHTLTHLPPGYHVRVNGKPVPSTGAAPNNPTPDNQK